MTPSVSPVAYTFRDAELKSRPLRLANGVGAGLHRLGVDRPSLTVDAVVSAAAKSAGSDDLGSDSYVEPLTTYLAACEEEAELTTFGRFLVSRMLSSALANRIQLHQWAEQHPEVRDEQVTAPWVIVGLPRTGTSLLSILLGLDPAARPLLHWEGAHPIPPPSIDGAAEDPRIAETAKELAGLAKLNPPLQAMHPFGATVAQECVALFMYDVRTLGLETQAHVPSYARWLEADDMAPAYGWHRLALQTLQSRQPTERWVLKTPNHLWNLSTLRATYPDARIIWTHRDPGPVVTSLASLANTAQRPLTSRTDPVPTAEEWKRKCVHALGSAMAYDDRVTNEGASKDGAEPGWCEHLHYEALIADPVAAVSGLYEQAGLECTPLHVRRMQAWMADRPADVHGKHVYDPADFGWTYAGINDELQAYIDRYSIPTPSAG
jgi:hypothetical protein